MLSFKRYTTLLLAVILSVGTTFAVKASEATSTATKAESSGQKVSLAVNTSAAPAISGAVKAENGIGTKASTETQQAEAKAEAKASTETQQAEAKAEAKASTEAELAENGTESKASTEAELAENGTESKASTETQQAEAKASTEAEHAEEGKIDIKEIIFHHLGDGYGWEVPFSHVYRIPLPVIVKAEDGKWFCFSSGKLTEVTVTENVETGKKHESLEPVIHKEIRDGKTYMFLLAHVSEHKNKVVEIFPLSDAEQEQCLAEAEKISATNHTPLHETVVPGYVLYDGKYYREYRTFDISITKNVLALIIASLLVTLMIMAIARYYRRRGMKAPRKGMGFLELLISFVYNDNIKPTLGAEKAKKFAPYLLTCFFFILTMNILGLVVIFPGGANLTGNIAITLVLAVLTFIMTNIHGGKHYWKEIFWPDVPMFLKFPLPIMQMIEVFGIFTKPAALCVRLFANMMGGHMIVLTLVCLIFIFAAFGMAAASGSVVISVIFTIFMLLLDVLVSFIQAYVFTLLSTIFISMAVADGHEHKEGEGHEATDVTEA